jgi:N-acetylneuraminate synthase
MTRKQDKTMIVAEIGCNHNGNPEMARRLVDAAKHCGVDAVKFQTFIATELISRYAPKAEYQKVTTGEQGNQLEMTRRLQLSHADLLSLEDHARGIGLLVFSTPFDMPSIDFLEQQGQQLWKIPSGEITNLPFLERIARIKCANKQIILSTGMSTMDEVQQAVDILLRDATAEELVLLHCNTEYPTPDEDVNLSAIDDLHHHFPDIRIGFSDHSVGSIAAVGAVMKDVVLIEKHFTLDKNLPGPDHKASATPSEMTQLVSDVRRAEVMRGQGGKRVTDSERRNINIARKSIVARRNIRKGELLTADNITCKRPGNGISPMHWYDVLGTTAIDNFNEDEMIRI